MYFKLGIYWLAKLKPILENKNQSKMGFKLGIYWITSKAKFYPRKYMWTNEFYTQNNIFVYGKLLILYEMLPTHFFNIFIFQIIYLYY